MPDLRPAGVAVGATLCGHVAASAQYVDAFGVLFDSLEQSQEMRTLNKETYAWAVEATKDLQKKIIQSPMAEYVPSYESPGSKVHALIRGEKRCLLAQVGPCLVEGLKQESIKYTDAWQHLLLPLLVKFAEAIDGAFADALALHPLGSNQPQATDHRQVHRIMVALLGPDSAATVAGLRRSQCTTAMCRKWCAAGSRRHC